ncbi:MAG: glycoside hydrolase family 3 protein, partial [Kiritimatiellia bacterium]
MDLQDKVGQGLVCNFTGTVIEPYHVRFIREFRCGGLRVTPHICSVNDEPRIRKLAPYNTPAQYAAVLKELQQIALSRSSGVPLQIVTDQEGDLSVDILRGGISLFPSNAGMAATGDPALVRKAFQVVGRQLRAIGINWIHSPVLDVNLNPRNPEIGMRSFSDDPELVARYGLAVVRGLLSTGVVATGKHFPGGGDSELDVHDTLDVLRVDRKRVEAVELHPYRKLIPQGLPAIMTAHNAYTALDDENVPASVSKKIVTGLLREELGFDGVVTTDAIGMAGVLEYAGNQWNASVLALEAGNDIILVKEDEPTTAKCFEAILAAVREGRVTERRV